MEVINIKDFLIEEYVNRLTLLDIKEFALSQGAELTIDETKILHGYVKNKWRTFMYGNPRKELDEIKEKVNPTTYQKIEMLFLKFKDLIS